MYYLPTGVSGILNTEEESLTKLKSILTNQLSVVNLPRGLHDNLSRQKALVDERLKLLQDQKLLFQVLYNPAVKRVCSPKKAIVKKDVKSKVAARNGCDGRLIAKILIMTIQVNLVCDHHLGFHIFFHNGLLGGLHTIL